MTTKRFCYLVERMQDKDTFVSNIKPIIRMGGLQLYVFLVNKTSGNGKGLRAWNRVESILKYREINYQVEFTKSPEEAVVWVQSLKTSNTFKALIVVGGDGTVQSILSELSGKQVPLGIIPAGSGNDFARSLGVSLNAERALNYILAGSIKKIDMIRVDKHYCITIAGLGLDGEVARTVNNSRYKRWLNKLNLERLSYVFGLVAVLFRYKPTSVRIKVDDREYTYNKVWLIAAANLPYYGGGMKICPNAQFSDGIMDICIVSGISRIKLLLIFPKVFQGSHINHPAVTMLRGESIYVSSDKPMVFHGGELLGQTPTEISVMKHSFHVIYNEYY